MIFTGKNMFKKIDEKTWKLFHYEISYYKVYGEGVKNNLGNNLNGIFWNIIYKKKL